MAMMRRDNEFSTAIGERLRNLRERHGLSPSELADRAYVSASDVYDTERGEPTTVSTLRRFAEVLGSRPNQFFDVQAPNPYRSAFLSYGGPDKPIANSIYRALRRRGIDCFFFPESAVPGVRLHRTMSQGIADHDRVILVCSQESLDRPGVLNEIEQVLIQEARNGGAELLIPITLDGYVFEQWSPDRPDIADQVRARVIADFRHARPGSRKWRREIARLCEALTK